MPHKPQNPDRKAQPEPPDHQRRQPGSTASPTRLGAYRADYGEAARLRRQPGSAASPTRPPTSPATPQRAKPDTKPDEPTNDNSPTESSAECGATKTPDNSHSRSPLDKGASDRPRTRTRFPCSGRPTPCPKSVMVFRRLVGLPLDGPRDARQIAAAHSPELGIAGIRRPIPGPRTWEFQVPLQSKVHLRDRCGPLCPRLSAHLALARGIGALQRVRFIAPGAIAGADKWVL